jgi:hypothetical protein
VIPATATQTQNARHRCGGVSAISAVGGWAPLLAGREPVFVGVESDIQSRLSPEPDAASLGE